MELAPFEVREKAIEESYRKLIQRERELLEWEERLRQEEEQLNRRAAVDTPPFEGAPVRTNTVDDISASSDDR